MVIPHDIDTEGIQPHSLNHQNTMLPVLDRNPRIMNFPSIDLRLLLSIEATRINIRLKRLITTTVMQIGCQARNENEEE